MKDFIEDPDDIKHVLFKQIPPSSFKNIKSTGGGKAQMSYYTYLMQVVVRNQSLVYSLDKLQEFNEINFMEDLD